MLRRIVYSSRAAEGITMRDVYDIIRVSHNRNSQSGITGGLVFMDGYFYQLLEGLPGSVEERYNRIATDPRHSDVITRCDKLVEKPIFESDWMALQDGSKVDQSILDQHNYKVGLSPDEFSGEQVCKFLLACFNSELISLA